MQSTITSKDLHPRPLSAAVRESTRVELISIGTFLIGTLATGPIILPGILKFCKDYWAPPRPGQVGH